MTKLKSHTRQLEHIQKCSICNKRPVEIYQLDYEVCFDCHQKETFISFADQVDIPEV